MSTGWWVGDLISRGETAHLASWVFWVILSICLHELAHGWAALWQGDDTPRTYGHMTLNPLVHMGPWSLLVFALTGLAWGAMPVNPSKFRWRKKGEIVVAAAGPAMNFLLAGVSIVALGVALGLFLRQGEPTDQNVRILRFFLDGAYLNIILGLFNLMPVPPLDGSRIIGGLSRRASQFFEQPAVQNFGFLLLMIVLFPIARGPIAAAAATVCESAAVAISRLFLPA